MVVCTVYAPHSGALNNDRSWIEMCDGGSSGDRPAALNQVNKTMVFIGLHCCAVQENRSILVVPTIVLYRVSCSVKNHHFG